MYAILSPLSRILDDPTKQMSNSVQEIDDLVSKVTSREQHLLITG
jgi:hypothetical protein